MRRLVPSIRAYDWGMSVDKSMAPLFIDDKYNGKIAELWWEGPSFLLKMLFVERPLSLQVHPNHAQLASFPYPYPKPEIVIAITEFRALCGFLEKEQVWDNIANIPGLCHYISFRSLFDAKNVCSILLSTREYALAHPHNTQCGLFLSLYELYPDDPATLAPFYMEHVCLKKGEALIIPGSQPHCYLSGQGVECMPPSDNIMRCGLTGKECHVDRFFDMCTTQNVITTTGPYKHEELDMFFLLHTPSGPFRCKKGSIFLILEGEKCGAWVAEEEEDVVFNHYTILSEPTLIC